MKRTFLICALALVAACSKSGPSGPTGDVIDAWKKAGLEVGDFAAADGKGIGATSCSVGQVGGIETTLCEFPDAETAKKGEKAGLVQVGDATGASMAQGKMLLIVADRTKSDPTGKKIKDLVSTFRSR